MSTLLFAMSVWLVVGAVLLLRSGRSDAGSGLRVGMRSAAALTLWLLAVASGLVAALASNPPGWTFLMGAVALVNLAVAVIAWRGAARLLAGLGATATVIGLTLAVIGAFSSLPILAAASVLCLGASLFSAPANALVRAPQG